MKPSKLLFSAGSLLAAASLFIGAGSPMFLTSGSASAVCTTICPGPNEPIVTAIAAVSTNKPPMHATISPPPIPATQVEYTSLLALIIAVFIGPPPPAPAPAP